MKEIRYQEFSLKTHRKNWRKGWPNVCQFELTFNCGLHCRHCYCDCYNKPDLIRKELDTKNVKLILDKVCGMGAMWLCLTGGDPLTRKDFPEIYSYAKQKGFIVTIFTNASSMTAKIADQLQKNPPFVIEITLNSGSQEGYERISQSSGSFERAMNGIRLIRERNLPLKIKTQATRDNLEELAGLKGFIEELGSDFKLNYVLHARLDKDPAPCSLRLAPKEVAGLDRRLSGKSDELTDSGDCQLMPGPKKRRVSTRKSSDPLFACAIAGGDLIYIDPYGNLIPCVCIREPKANVCRESIAAARRSILSWVRTRTFVTDSPCRTCRIRASCLACPGKALLEKGSLEAQTEWFCALAGWKKAAGQ